MLFLGSPLNIASDGYSTRKGGWKGSWLRVGAIYFEMC